MRMNLFSSGFVNRRSFVAGVLLAAAGGPARAQEFPSRPLRLVVGYGPGGVGDIVARSVAQKLSESMGQNVVVENMPGAGGITAASAVARAPANGYTLLLVSTQNAFSPWLFKSLPYDPVESFSTISTLGRFDFLVVVDKDSPFKTLNDLIAAAKRDPQHFSVGSISVGSGQNLSAKLLLSMAGVDVPVVPFRATGDVISSMKGKNIQAAVETTTAVMNQVKGGSLRALAVFSRKRLSLLPDVPTVAETGIEGLATFEADTWNGIVAPAGTPRDVVVRLNSEIAKALTSPDLRRRLLSLGVEPSASTPEQLKEEFIQDGQKWGAVIRQSNVEKR